ncbi:hypothetical protein F5B22DRAFT_119285 [Xylaria bambusicola]|uniref:uncharacterized protein n=1 Tax=Xylaria bambusicola TaxID=326684 RepID=UPI002007E43E|nr:uncharacterized protein F5B22DRAFT_119285 [Xylaria bambusicola]KAI0517355.1 hypothetical protein F5B22DRAFT_119285 [Xylaria bambusicola]
MESPFMRIPAEVRLMIYSYLFDAGEAGDSICKDEGCLKSGSDSTSSKKRSKIISIRNRKEPTPLQSQAPDRGYDFKPRTRYHILDRSFRRRRVEVTYGMANKGAYFCTALMRVNRAVWAETSHLVYAKHEFDFGADVEAPKPFLSDLTPQTRGLVKRIAIYKRGPWLFDSWNDRCEWQTMCAYLCESSAVEHLRLIVQAGRLPSSGGEEEEEEKEKEKEKEWASPRELSKTDVALLVDIRHDTLDWVSDLVNLNKLREVEVEADFGDVPRAQNSNMFVFMAFSASIERGFKEFLKWRLGLS